MFRKPQIKTGLNENFIIDSNKYYLISHSFAIDLALLTSFFYIFIMVIISIVKVINKG